jgi:predicted DNA-binding transcriptional regulator AlpA
MSDEATLTTGKRPADRADGPGEAAGPGLCVAELGRLPAGTILDERELARLFGCCRASVKRAVARGELPEPVRMFGRPCWTAGRILEHVADRLAAAQKEAEREAARLSRLSP